MCKSAKNETKIFLDYLGHDLGFASKKLDHLVGILRNKIFAFELKL